MQHLILVGDIGGTNSRFAIYSPKDTSKCLFYKEYSTQGHADPGLAYGGFHRMLELAVRESLASQGHSFSLDGSVSEASMKLVACFACAGPVSNNVCQFTNVAGGTFQVNGAAIVETFHPYIPVAKVVNDFVGMGYGVLTVDIKKECIVIHPGEKAIMDPVGPIACVGAGTGLGECYLTSSTGKKEGYTCFASEGGHSDYVPRSMLDMEMLQFIRDKYGGNRASVERVCSGTGLVNIYEFLVHKFPNRVDAQVHEKIMNAGDMKGKFIAMNANPDSLCEQVMNCFATTYGAEVGSVAAKFIPTGGIFLTGGLTPKNLKYIEGSGSPFMKAYLERGRLSNLMKSIPVYAVIPEDLGVRGACYLANKVSKIMNIFSRLDLLAIYYLIYCSS